jgi:L-cysteine:1D-myo-inositol 2-amino-2-deoxy-alpha-D-glucopyranoside ligase
MVIRLVLLGHHYRSDWQWEESDVSAAGARLDKWRSAVAKPAGAPTEHLVTDVLTALATDLDAPFALRLIDHWANTTDFGDASEPGAGDVVRALVEAALGVRL